MMALVYEEHSTCPDCGQPKNEKGFLYSIENDYQHEACVALVRARRARIAEVGEPSEKPEAWDGHHFFITSKRPRPKEVSGAP